MSRSRSLVAALVALVVGLAVATTASSSTATPSASAPDPAFRVRQSASLTINPQLAQPGTAAASPSSAKSALVAQFKPAKPGRKVLLLTRKGSRWVKASTTRQNTQGRAEFVAPLTVRGKYQSYRVQALSYRGLAKVTSKPKSTRNKWRSASSTDTFAGTALPSTWAHRPTTYDGMRHCATANPANMAVAGGALRLSVTKNAQGRQIGTDLLGRPIYDPTCEVGGKSYSYRYTGHVSTEGQKAFKYGFAAARMKFQKGAGQHAAFWMMPATSTAANPGTEIDVVEYFGDRRDNNTELTSFVQRTYTTPTVKDRTCGQIRKPSRYGKDWWKKYHVYSVEWTKSRYVFRIDGKETCRTSKLVSHTPEYLILSLQANDYELKYASSLPQHMYVDWVRYWKQ